MEINVKEILKKHGIKTYTLPSEPNFFEPVIYAAIEEIITEVLKNAGKEVYNMPMKQEERLVCEGFITSTINKVKF